MVLQLIKVNNVNLFFFLLINEISINKKNALIAFAVFSLVALTIVIIILLKPGKNPHGCGSGYLCKKTDKCIDKDMCTKIN